MTGLVDLVGKPYQEVLHREKIPSSRRFDIFAAQILAVAHGKGEADGAIELILTVLAFAALATTDLTLKSGASMFTPPNLATLGVVFSGMMSDYQLGGKLGFLAMNLLN